MCDFFLIFYHLLTILFHLNIDMYKSTLLGAQRVLKKKKKMLHDKLYVTGHHVMLFSI